MLETAVDGDPVEGYGLPPRVGGHFAAPRPPRHDRLDPWAGTSPPGGRPEAGRAATGSTRETHLLR